MVETTADIDAQIDLPDILNRWLPDVTFAWIDEGVDPEGQPRKVMGLNVNLDAGVELAITGGADGELLRVADDGISLQGLQPFDVDAPIDSHLPNVLSVELALRDGDGTTFDHTRAYVLVRPEDTDGHPYLDAVRTFIQERLPDLLDWLDGGLSIDTGDLIDFLRDGFPIGESGDDDPLVTSEAFELPDASDIPALWQALQDAREALQNAFQQQDEDGPSNDFVLGSREGGQMPGGQGWDFFLGRSEDDTVVYDGLRQDFDHDELCPGVVAVHKPGSESDLLVGVDRISFDDGDLVFDIGGDNTGFVYRMYEACFDRTPDEGGLRFWTGIVDSLKEREPWVDVHDFLADRFLTSGEFKDLFGDNPSNGDYITAMYENVLGRQADQSGHDFWVGGMENGLGFDDILIAFTECEENVAGTIEDLINGIWVA